MDRCQLRSPGACARCRACQSADTWARHPDGSFGRGIQYPFIAPAPGEYPAEWDASKLEPWKHIVRDLLAHHATHPESALGHISCEHIVGVDYGAGHAYSTFENNVACARWLRDAWAQAVANAAEEPVQRAM